MLLNVDSFEGREITSVSNDLYMQIVLQILYSPAIHPFSFVYSVVYPVGFLYKLLIIWATKMICCNFRLENVLQFLNGKLNHKFYRFQMESFFVRHD